MCQLAQSKTQTLHNRRLTGKKQHNRKHAKTAQIEKTQTVWQLAQSKTQTLQNRQHKTAQSTTQENKNSTIKDTQTMRQLAQSKPQTLHSRQHTHTKKNKKKPGTNG